MTEPLENLTYEDVKDILETEFPIKPLRNKVIVTVNNYEDEDQITVNTGVDEVQYVLAVGSFVKDIVPGEKVLLDLEKMIKSVETDPTTGERVPQIAIRPVKVYDRYFAMLPDSYIEAVDNR